MNAIHWFEAKQLDRVTNYSSRTECIKNVLDFDGELYYYCSFSLKNRHKAQRKAKFYINKCRSASCMQGGLKQASA